MQINEQSMPDAVVGICKALGITEFESISRIRNLMTPALLKGKKDISILRHKKLNGITVTVKVGKREVVVAKYSPHQGYILMNDWMKNHPYIGEPRKAIGLIADALTECKHSVAYKVDVQLSRTNTKLSNWTLGVSGWNAKEFNKECAEC